MTLRTQRRSRGSALMEAALWIPVIFLLFMGTTEIARVTYTYYSLQKTLYTVARAVSALQNVNFCDESDPGVAAAKQIAISGSNGTSQGGTTAGDSLIQGLTADQITIRIQRYSPETGSLADCECSAEAGGCDAGMGARGPDYVTATIPDGYAIQLRIPGLSSEPILLKPRVLLPFNGT